MNVVAALLGFFVLRPIINARLKTARGAERDGAAWGAGGYPRLGEAVRGYPR